MKKINSYDEYKEIIKKYRGREYYSNNYFLAGKVNRYILLNRAFYEETEAGLLLYFDEEKCYRMVIYTNLQNTINISLKDKKIYFRNVYKKGADETLKMKLGNRLLESGFVLKGTTMHMRADADSIIQKLDNVDRIWKRFENNGFKRAPATPDMYDECEQLLLQSGTIFDYQIDYRTYEEKKALEEGAYYYISDNKGKIVASSVCYIDNNIGQGVGIAVDEKYKRLGLVMILADYRYRWYKEKKVKFINGWVLTDNTESIRYHTSLGYEFDEKYADEWILEENRSAKKYFEYA